MSGLSVKLFISQCKYFATLNIFQRLFDVLHTQGLGLLIHGHAHRLCAHPPAPARVDGPYGRRRAVPGEGGEKKMEKKKQRGWGAWERMVRVLESLSVRDHPLSTYIPTTHNAHTHHTPHTTYTVAVRVPPPPPLSPPLSLLPSHSLSLLSLLTERPLGPHPPPARCPRPSAPASAPASRGGGRPRRPGSWPGTDSPPRPRCGGCAPPSPSPRPPS